MVEDGEGLAEGWQVLEVLVLVKTYPRPSLRHQEVVCTAGITRDGRWVRLYPIDYRDKPYDEWFKKYEWIRVPVKKHQRDRRPESYRPHPGKPIERIGFVPAEKNWAQRREIALARPASNMCELQKLGPTTQSLAVVKPKEIVDFMIQPDSPQWKPGHQHLCEQLHLFGSNQRPLEKVPWKFSYHYYCCYPSWHGHKQVVLDWELFQLFRKMRDRKGEHQALVDVKTKFLHQMCGADRDPYFFAGNINLKRAWAILGVLGRR